MACLVLHYCGRLCFEKGGNFPEPCTTEARTYKLEHVLGLVSDKTIGVTRSLWSRMCLTTDKWRYIIFQQFPSIDNLCDEVPPLRVCKAPPSKIPRKNTKTKCSTVELESGSVRWCIQPKKKSKIHQDENAVLYVGVRSSDGFTFSTLLSQAVTLGSLSGRVAVIPSPITMCANS